MMKIGTYVVYGGQGVCRIEDIRRENLTGEQKDYYILSPADDPKMTVYVPVDSATLTGQMRALLSEGELDTLLRDGNRDGSLEWINDPRQRNEAFKGILNSGDRKMLFRLLHTIHERKKEQEAIGRKLYAADEQILERAEKLLHGEIAAILHIPTAEVSDYITKRLGLGG